MRTTMYWFRSRSRLGAYLALFALAFQLVLSFGHLHLEALATGASVVVSAQAQPNEPQSSDLAGHELPARADGYCVVCALIHLAGSLTPAAPPSLPVPVSFDRLQRATAVAVELTAVHRAPFAARAPPIA
jgi:Protein of unknown function (DUF2946)